MLAHRTFSHLWPIGLILILGLTSCQQSFAANRAASNAATSTPNRTLLPIIGSSNVRGGAWASRAPLKLARQEIAVAAYAGKLYAFGGYGADHSTLNSAEVYDPATNQWDWIAPMPVALNHPASAVLGDKLYVIGGFNDAGASDALLEYDPAKDVWTKRRSLPTPRGAAAAAIYNGQIYVVGGMGSTSIGDLIVYDPSQDAWSTLPPMPTPRNHLAAVVANNHLLVFGGRDERTSTMNVLESYDFASQTWQTLAPMPTGRSGHAAAELNGCVYVFGGEPSSQPGGTFRENERYNPSTNQWEAATELSIPRHGLGAAVLTDTALGLVIHLPGGATLAGFGAVAAHEVFTSTVTCA